MLVLVTKHKCEFSSRNLRKSFVENHTLHSANSHREEWMSILALCACNLYIRPCFTLSLRNIRCWPPARLIWARLALCLQYVLCFNWPQPGSEGSISLKGPRLSSKQSSRFGIVVNIEAVEWYRGLGIHSSTWPLALCWRAQEIWVAHIHSSALTVWFPTKQWHNTFLKYWEAMNRVNTVIMSLITHLRTHLSTSVLYILGNILSNYLGKRQNRPLHCCLFEVIISTESQAYQLLTHSPDIASPSAQTQEYLTTFYKVLWVS